MDEFRDKYVWNNSFWTTDHKTHVLKDEYRLLVDRKYNKGDKFFYKCINDNVSNRLSCGTFIITLKKLPVIYECYNNYYGVESCEKIAEKEEITVYVVGDIPPEYIDGDVNFFGRSYTKNNFDRVVDKIVFLYKTKIYNEREEESFYFIPHKFDRVANIIDENMLDVDDFLPNFRRTYCENIDVIMMQLLDTRYDEKARRFFEIKEKLTELYDEFKPSIIDSEVFFDLTEKN